jgi:hypothetical protein
VLMLLSIVPVYFAQRLAGGTEAVKGVGYGSAAAGGDAATPVAPLETAEP